jgi:hypothetical protein
VALLLFPTCADVHGVKVKPQDVPGLRKERDHLEGYLADGTYIVRTAAGEALAISIPRIEAGADHLQSEILAEMRAAAKLEVGSRAGARSGRR